MIDFRVAAYKFSLNKFIATATRFIWKARGCDFEILNSKVPAVGSGCVESFWWPVSSREVLLGRSNLT